MVRASEDNTFINLGPIWEESVLEIWRFYRRFNDLGVLHLDCDIRVNNFIFSIHVLDDGSLPIHEFNMEIPDLC